ncbi:MAG TPA: hypothetical protein VKG22_03020, partial [Stellaceae bacterium]|nr:hypothetical protein [Stellaceae bacterium]
ALRPFTGASTTVQNQLTMNYRGSILLHEAGNRPGRGVRGPRQARRRSPRQRVLAPDGSMRAQPGRCYRSTNPARFAGQSPLAALASAATRADFRVMVHSPPLHGQR